VLNKHEGAINFWPTHGLCTDTTKTVAAVANEINLFDEGTPTGNVCSFFVQLSSSQLIRKQVPKGFTDMEDVDEQGYAYRGVDACFFKAFNDLRTKLFKNFGQSFFKNGIVASTRSYLAQADELKFPQPVIDWIEKHKSGTGCSRSEYISKSTS